MQQKVGRKSYIFNKYFNSLYRFASPIIAILSIVFIILIAGLGHLTENNDGRIFFNESSPERLRLLALEQRFTETNSLLLVLSVKNGDVFAKEPLNAILDLTEKAWQLPFVTRVNSLSNYQKISSENDDLIIKDLITEDTLADEKSLDQMRSYALSEKDLIGQILSKDGKTTAIVLNIAAPRGDSSAIQEIMSDVENIRHFIKKQYPGISLYVTGDVPLDNAFSDAYDHDLQVLFPVFLLVIFAMGFFFFRMFWLAFILLAMMIMVVATTMGAAGYLGINLTAGTSGVPIILITIALSDFVHLLSSRRMGIKSGLDEKQAVRLALRSDFLPITLTSFTTFIGFISLNFSEAPPFRDMGNLVALGIIFSYVITFTVFPIILMKLDLKKSHSMKPNRFSVESKFITRFSSFLVRRVKLLVLVIILFSMGICGGVTRLQFDDDWVKYFDKENSFRQDTEFVSNNLTGVDTIDYMLSSGDNGQVTNPEFLNRLDQFENWAHQQPEIVHVASILNIFKKMNFYMNGAQSVDYAISQNPDLNAQYLLMYEMSLPVGLDLNDRIDIAKKNTRITITGQDLTSRELRDLDKKISHKLREVKLIGASDLGTGIPLMFANLSERNIKSMLGGIIFALALVSLVIIVTFRSAALGLISFIVNILPIIIGFGVWGWVYQYVGVSLTIVAAIAFGIVVDDSIHFVTKYYEVKAANNRDIQGSLEDTFSQVGNALVMTTCILVLGFFTLTFSSFQPTWGLGLISAIMIIFALIYDFLFLPALLILIRPFYVSR